MQSQTPAQGISLNRDFGDAKYFTVRCQCGNKDDDIEMFVELDREYGDITVSFNVISTTHWWEASKLDHHWLRNIWNAVAHRCKVTWDIWVHGRAEYQTYTVLDQQTALNFAAALQQSVQDIQEHKSYAKNRN